MKTNLAVAVVGTVLGGLVAAALLSGRASTAEPAVERPTVGRYQMLVRDELGGGPDEGIPAEKAHVVRNRLIVLDTATGQCWQRDDKEKKWESLGNPAKSK